MPPPEAQPERKPRVARGVSDARITITASVPDGFNDAFRKIAEDRTHENKRALGRKGKAVTQRQLHEEAIRDLLDTAARGEAIDVQGGRHRHLRKSFWLSVALYEDMQALAEARNIPATYLFITACVNFLQKLGYLKD